MSFGSFYEGAAPATPPAGRATVYVATGGEPHIVASTGADVNLTPNRKFNWVRNGGFWFAQRQAPGTLTTYSATAGRAITADGFGVTNENASVQFRRVDTASAPETNLAGRFYGEFTKITSTGKIVVSQVIEGTDTGVLRGSTVRVQVKLKAVTTNLNVRIGLAQLTSAGTMDTMPATFVSAFGTNPTLGTNLSYLTPKTGVNGEIAGVSTAVTGNVLVVPAVTTGWTRAGLVFDVPTDAKNLVVVIYSEGQIAAAAGFAVGEVTLTDGMAIQDWAPTSIAQELVRVQRYYSKSFGVDTAPAQNAGLAGVWRGYVNGAGIVAGEILGIRFPVTMRVSSYTITFYNPSAANAFARNTAAANDATATASANPGDAGTDVTFTGIVGWVVGQSVAVHYTADAEM